jgi:glycosyltransferase involved in cell wall biosynthesis
MSKHIDVQEYWLSILVPTYNRLHSLQQFLFPSLEAQDLQGVEVIIADDCSTDATEDYLKDEVKKDFPQVAGVLRYTKNPQNAGAPASRNRAAELARAPWVWIVEDDIQIQAANFLRIARDILAAQPQDVAVVSPQRTEGRPMAYYPQPQGVLVREGWLSKEVYLDPTQQFTGFVTNTHASSFVRTDAYLAVRQDEVQFFGNTFRDETDFYTGIKRKAGKILYVGDVLQIDHRNDQITSGGQKKVMSIGRFGEEKMIWANHRKYLAKHYSFVGLRLAAFVLVRAVKVAANTLRMPWIKALQARIAL